MSYEIVVLLDIASNAVIHISLLQSISVDQLLWKISYCVSRHQPSYVYGIMISNIQTSREISIMWYSILDQCDVHNILYFKIIKAMLCCRNFKHISSSDTVYYSALHCILLNVITLHCTTLYSTLLNIITLHFSYFTQ